MIIGIGMDLVKINRMNHWLKNKELCLRFFDSEEFEAITLKGSNALASLAARFAAKEAFAKALGTGFKGLLLRDIKVNNNAHGRPELILSGTAARAMKKVGAKKIHLSITHEDILLLLTLYWRINA